MNAGIGHKRTQRLQKSDLKDACCSDSASLFFLRSFEAKKRGNQSGGFTLLEMMLALATFVLLAASAFALLGGVIETSSTLQDNQNLHDQTVALNAYLKKKLGTMPSNSTIASYQRGNGEGLVQNGIIFGNKNFATAIDAKVQANGFYTVRQATLATSGGTDEVQDARIALQQSASTDDPTLTWISLMTDIKTIDWKFLDFNQTVWVELWSSSANPNLVEFDLQPAADQQPSTMDFWIPKVDTITLNLNQNGGGGGRGGGGGGGGGRNGGGPGGQGGGGPGGNGPGGGPGGPIQPGGGQPRAGRPGAPL